MGDGVSYNVEMTVTERIGANGDDNGEYVRSETLEVMGNR